MKSNGGETIAAIVNEWFQGLPTQAEQQRDRSSLIRQLQDRFVDREQAARAIEIEHGIRCPECGGKSATGLIEPRRCGAGHTWKPQPFGLRGGATIVREYGKER